MIGLLLAVAATTSAAPQWHRDGNFPQPGAVLELVGQCGLVGSEIVYDELYQADMVIVPPDTLLSDEQLDCIARTAFETGYQFGLPEAYISAFYHRREAIAGPWNIQLARQWLDDMDKLDSLPTQGSSESDADFARRLEALCGTDGALSSDFGPHSISPDWVRTQSGDVEQMGQGMFCLMAAGAANGYPIYMIGNDIMHADGAE